MTGEDRRPGVDGACGHVTGPHAPDTRLYPCGWRCALHTPNALAGRPEAPPGPGWPVHRQPPPGLTPEDAAPTGAEHEQEERHDRDRTGSSPPADPR
ncbi:hypothetical protein ACFZCV_20825 [Streptomyces sp. NPDC007920]|uniref:hypothetical protein n=1 Tax=Streptomyces sp. NPDC007920 TaxID=3364794 RepID=UPI0036E08683